MKRLTNRHRLPVVWPIEAVRDLQPTICELVLSLDVGGAETLAKEFADSANGSFRFVFACLDRCGPLGEQLRDGGHEVYVLHRKPGTDLGCAWRLARFCREQGVELIHAHQCGPFHYAALARFVAPKFPILLTEHGRHQPDRRSWKRCAANRLLLHRSDRVVAVGNVVKAALVANEGIPARRIDIIYNGRDLSKYQRDPALRASARRRLGIRDDEVLIMQVARLSPEKDHATSLGALARLIRSQFAVRLVLVGDGAERPAVVAMIEKFGLQHFVELLGVRKDVEKLLPAADICALSSVSEGIPLTLIEGMAAGLPCVATRVGGVSEVVAENETGLLAEPSDACGFADCLQRLIVDPAMRARMGQAARRRAELLFDKRAMQAAYADLFGKMLGVQCHREPLQSVC